MSGSMPRRADAPGSSRRGSAEWARPREAVVPLIDVLVPSYERPAELAVTLAGLAGQDDPPFRVIVSDQSAHLDSIGQPAVQAMVRVLEAQGRPVELLRHLPRRGIAEHRQFLLERATAPLVLFLDDDVWLEPGTLDRMTEALDRLGCGFVGSAVQGLSYLDDDRPQERAPLELWDGPVTPETITRESEGFGRWTLHNAANLAHAASALDLGRDEWVAYRVAWVGGCVLYRRDALLECGGFNFWSELPADHAGEDVAAQWRVMARYGGAGILPSGAVHLEAPTTLPHRGVEATDVVSVP
ncbi:glycosyltransferase family 2 protein [Salinibacterium sp. SYSU T00001]|uniref:glycosyltransferase n=1 Tax=Homoserinimonas sedimenticola TaxID=2986805 RepID=UPI002236B0B2|nr:glycosyltransferase family 2 protein [Salinibacterium sedimenticola]MCW4385602.1 glycosyltransferase family 2 protein [Salinibacterium sedimenticola]